MFNGFRVSIEQILEQRSRRKILQDLDRSYEKDLKIPMTEESELE